MEIINQVLEHYPPRIQNNAENPSKIEKMTQKIEKSFKKNIKNRYKPP